MFYVFIIVFFRTHNEDCCQNIKYELQFNQYSSTLLAERNTLLAERNSLLEELNTLLEERNSLLVDINTGSTTYAAAFNSSSTYWTCVSELFMNNYNHNRATTAAMKTIELLLCEYLINLITASRPKQ